jgi:S-methylmethionine-dependent homocysteine/selenocysteine methylase
MNERIPDSITALHDRIELGELVIMDGGTGSEFRRRGVEPDPVTWAAGPLITHPEVNLAIHEDYLRAGAEIIITNTFGTNPELLAKIGLSHRAEELNRLAVVLARQAIDNVKPKQQVVVAGGIPAIATSFIEYYSDFHAQADVLADAGVDLLIVEMATRIADVERAVAAGVATGVPTWAGLTCFTHEGESYMGVRSKHQPAEKTSDAARMAEEQGASVIFVMHSAVEDTVRGLESIRQVSSLPIGAYSHNASTEFVGPERYLEYARDWVRVGAQVVGGCCRTTPAHVEALTALRNF